MAERNIPKDGNGFNPTGKFSSRWFRFYNDALYDPKVQKLPPELFKTWVNLLCLAGAQSGYLPPKDDIVYALRLSEEEVESQLSSLVACSLLDDREGILRPHNWDRRQHKSDSSTQRTRDWRERHRDGHRTLSHSDLLCSALDDATWRQHINYYLDTMYWSAKLGPKPGHLACLVPVRLLAQYKFPQL